MKFLKRLPYSILAIFAVIIIIIAVVLIVLNVGFCGTSSKGPCDTDSDCYTSGCSGTECVSVQEEDKGLTLTGCDWKDCYDDEAYNMECRCVKNKCQWDKQ